MTAPSPYHTSKELLMGSLDAIMINVLYSIDSLLFFCCFGRMEERRPKTQNSKIIVFEKTNHEGQELSGLNFG